MALPGERWSRQIGQTDGEADRVLPTGEAESVFSGWYMSLG